MFLKYSKFHKVKILSSLKKQANKRGLDGLIKLKKRQMFQLTDKPLRKLSKMSYSRLQDKPNQIFRRLDYRHNFSPKFNLKTKLSKSLILGNHSMQPHRVPYFKNRRKLYLKNRKNPQLLLMFLSSNLIGNLILH